MKNKKGFTLVELLVVVVILGIISGLSIPLIRNIQENNKDREFTAYMDNLKYSAKLYVDSYGEDLFGKRKTGCTIIRYRDLSEKGLLKDIPIDKLSCASNKTFVKVVKLDNKYGYSTSIGCGNVDRNGNVVIDKYLSNTGSEVNETCDIDAKTIMSINAVPKESASIKYKQRNVKLTITSDTGINNNMQIYYGYSYNKDTNVINNNWRLLPVKVPGKKSQKENIISGKAISITTDDLTTPVNVTGELYLVIRIDKLENLATEAWTTEKQDNFLYFGPYTVDNIKPKFNNSTVISSEAGFNSIKPKLQLKVTDEKYSTINDLRMCISYDTDTCSTKVSDMKDNSKYEKYNANKVLPEIKNNYDSTTHIVYVTVADAAGNYEKANYPYRLASRYTITYDSNGGVACNPTSKSLTFNNWEKEPTWGSLCSPTRTNYTFTGWNTKKDGSGETITSATKATKNLTVCAQWRENRVIFNIKLLDSGTLTAQTRFDKGDVYNWTKDSNNYIYLNGKRYTTSISFSAKKMDLPNYNNPKFLNITKTGYKGEPSKEWICIEGCKANNQTFNHSEINITPSNICDYSKADCTVTLKVNWVIIPYNITYNLNDGSVSGNPTSYNITSDPITLKNPERKGYTFTGWTGSNGTTTQTTVTIPKGSTGDKTYTANWRASTFTVVYHNNGGTGTMENTVCTYNADCTLRKNTFTKGGSIFNGWSTTVNGEKMYDDLANVKNTKTSGTLTLYAKWKPVLSEWNYTFTGGVQNFTVPYTGTYKLEVWGAQGGNGNDNHYVGGKGGYARGNIKLFEGDVLHIYVGGKGGNSTLSTSGAAGGWNGGGKGGTSIFGYYEGSGGGGATDMRLNNTNLSNRVIVAGGGGGGAYYDWGCTHSSDGGAGGGKSGGSVYNSSGGTQTSGFALGNGQDGRNGDECGGYCGYEGNPGAGGGYYGGTTTQEKCNYTDAAASGGSGYIGGVSDGNMDSGVQEGNGKAKFSFVN